MPCFCLRSKSAALREETQELEEEQERLQAEVAHVQKSIENSEKSRQNVEEEIKQVSSLADEKEARARAAEEEREKLLEEMAEASAPAPVSESLNGEDLQVPPPRDKSSSHDGDAQLAATSWNEAEQLMRKITELRSELEQSRAAAAAADSPGGGQAHAAEAAAAELRGELEERRAALAVSEEEGQRLAEEHQRLLQEEAPLNDWVRHVEHELSLARDEHHELSQAFARTSDERADLRRDELAALPLRQVGIDVTQVGWLQEKERENIERKAALLEEIAAHRGRRTELLAQAARYRQEARNHEEESMSERSDLTQVFNPLAYPVSRTSYSGSPSAAPVLGNSSQLERPQGLVKSIPKVHVGTAGVDLESRGGRARDALKHYDMEQLQSRRAPVAKSSLQHPSSPTAKVVPVAKSSLQHPSSPIAKVVAAGRLPPMPQVEDADREDLHLLTSNHQILLPDLPSRSSSGQEDMGGPANYWESLDEEEESFLE